MGSLGWQKDSILRDEELAWGRLIGGSTQPGSESALLLDASQATQTVNLSKPLWNESGVGAKGGSPVMSSR